MVAKKKAALNKSAEIRKALAQYPDKGPAAIAKLLSQEHGVPFRAKAVSSIKTKLGQQPASDQPLAAPSAAQQTPTQRPAARSAASAARESVAAMVTNLQAYIQRHGKEDLHRLIDTL
jgi:hypothetical protein